MKYLKENSEARGTVIVLAPLSDEVYIRQGNLHNTMQRGTMHKLNMILLIYCFPSSVYYIHNTQSQPQSDNYK